MVVAFNPGLLVSSNPAYAPGSLPAFDGGGFLPNSLSGGVLWLDAAAPATITKDGSNKVSQWDDKFPTANNATQGTGANQPTLLIGEINGRDAISLTGGAPPFMTLDATINGTDLTVFSAFVSTESNGQGTILGDSGGNERMMAYDPDIGGDGALVTNDGTTQVIFNLTSSFKDISVLLMNEFEVGVGQRLSFNGDLKKTDSYDGTIISDQIGRLGTGIQVGGNLGELLVYNRILSASEILAVEIYLSNKWGITLP